MQGTLVPAGADVLLGASGVFQSALAQDRDERIDLGSRFDRRQASSDESDWRDSARAHQRRYFGNRPQIGHEIHYSDLRLMGS